MNQLAPNPFIGRLSAGIVKRYRLYLILFIGMVIFSLFSLNWVTLEDDVVQYLSEDSAVRQCLNTVETEFTTFGRATVMVEDVTDEDVDIIQTALEDYDNVAYASPVVVQQEDGTQAVRFSLAFYSGEEDEETQATVDGLAEMIKQFPNSSIYCSLQENAATVVIQQMSVVLVMVSIIVVVVLLFTTRSYAEVAVLLITFLTAAAINMGTHFFFGTISIYSNAVAVVMQLALSLDYAIIFVNRYREAHETLPYRPSVIKALAGSIPEILSSSLTTIAGLVAMTFMVFKLGGDMGVVLIKSIFISLFTVFFFMPALLLLFGRAMDRTQHKDFVPKIDFVGRFAHRSQKIIPIFFIALVIIGCVISSQVNYGYDTTAAPSNRYTEARLTYLNMDEKVGMNQMEILVPSGDYRNESLLIQALEKLPGVRMVSGLASVNAIDDYTLYSSLSCFDFQELSGLDDLTSRAVFAYYAASVGDQKLVAEDMASYRIPLVDLLTFLYNHKDDESLSIDQSYRDQIADLYAPLGRILEEMKGDNYSLIYLDTSLPISDPVTFDFLDEVQATIDKYYPDGSMMAGLSVIDREFCNAFSTDKTTVGVLSIVMVLVILFFTFRSAVLPIVLIFLIQGSVWLDFSIPALTGEPVYFICYLIASSIMMGSNIDYAIVMSSRYRELRDIGTDKLQSVTDSINFALPTIITSGSIMALSGLLMFFISTEGVLSGFGKYLGIGTCITLVLVLFVLPQLLLLFDKLIHPFALPSFKKKQFHAFRRLGAALLVVVSVISLIVIPFGYNKASAEISRDTETQEALLSDVEAAQELNESFKNSFTEIDGVRYSFAELFLTQKIGTAKYDAGNEEYTEGAAQLAEGQKTYDDSLALYNESSQQLEDGKKQLADGKSEYNSKYSQYEDGLAAYQSGKQTYEENLALYNEGKKQYENGQATLAAAQAEYDQGLATYNAGLKQYNEGKAKYDASLAEYNESKEQYENLKPIMDSTLVKLYNAYEQAQANYKEGDIAGKIALDAAEKALNTRYDAIVKATGMNAQGRSIAELMDDYNNAEAQLADAEVQLADAKAQLEDAEKQLADGKAQLDAGKEQLDAGQAQLDAAKVQLEDAERQLADGEQQLDDAEVQLTDAEKQLADGKKKIDDAESQIADGEAQLTDAEKQLADGKAQLDDGYEQLADAEQQLAEGKETLEENNAKLLSNLSELDTYESKKTEVENSINALVEESGVALVGNTETYLDNLKNSCEESIKNNSSYQSLSHIFLICSLASSLIGLISLLIQKFSKKRVIKIISVSVALFTALVSLTLCGLSIASTLWFLIIPIIVLAVFYLINLLLLCIKHRA